MELIIDEADISGIMLSVCIIIISMAVILLTIFIVNSLVVVI